MQKETGKPDSPKKNRPYHGPVFQAFITHLIFFLAAPTCTSDMGASGWACNIAAIPFWGAVVFLMFRNPAPSWVALAFVRWGLIPILLIGVPVLHPIVSPLHTNYYYPKR